MCFNMLIIESSLYNSGLELKVWGSLSWNDELLA